MKQYKVGFICGFFDILHDGHIDILEWSKKQCDMLIVAVGTDEFMIRRKQRETVLSYEQRVKVVRAIRYVDKVVKQEDLDKMAAYQRYKFDVMFAGDDHENEPIYVEYAKELKRLGVDTIYYKRNDVSSTKLRARVSQITRE